MVRTERMERTERMVTRERMEILARNSKASWLCSDNLDCARDLEYSILFYYLLEIKIVNIWLLKFKVIINIVCKLHIII